MFYSSPSIKSVISHFSVFSYVASELLPRIGGLRASYEIHRQFLANILRLPMTFFWTNTNGRILSRCSKDVDVVDGPLPRQMDSFTFFVLQVTPEVYGGLTPRLIVLTPFQSQGLQTMSIVLCTLTNRCHATTQFIHRFCISRAPSFTCFFSCMPLSAPFFPFCP